MAASTDEERADDLQARSAQSARKVERQQRIVFDDHDLGGDWVRHRRQSKS